MFSWDKSSNDNVLLIVFNGDGSGIKFIITLSLIVKGWKNFRLDASLNPYFPLLYVFLIIIWATNKSDIPISFFLDWRNQKISPSIIEERACLIRDNLLQLDTVHSGVNNGVAALRFQWFLIIVLAHAPEALIMFLLCAWWVKCQVRKCVLDGLIEFVFGSIDILNIALHQLFVLLWYFPQLHCQYARHFVCYCQIGLFCMIF